MSDLPSLLINKLEDLFLHWDWKKGFFVALTFILLLCAIIGFLLYLLYLKNEKIRDLSNSSQILRLEKENFKKENKDLRSKLGVLGLTTEQYTGVQKNASDFKKDWDTSSFYIIEDNIFCPKKKGKNNYQRMFYRYDTPLTANDFSLKFSMADQDDNITNYTQRIVIGLRFEKKVLSEFDIPTRGAQVVNFRVASESGRLIPGGPGKSISSPIKDKSIINLKFETQFKSNQEITQFIDLDYFSSISDYGDEKETVSYDVKVNDPQPKTAKSNIFIGSYSGGCIKIINWNAN